ncbi:hypothetical protein BGZ96_001562, partial [Linnemannia gamsii]
GEPFERAGSYDVSQDFEQLSIDDLQRAFDAELEDGNYDLALYSQNATATAGVENGGDEEFVQVERTDSMAEMDISDFTMSPTAAKDSLPQETREVITQTPSQEPTQDIVQEFVQPTSEAVFQGAIYTEESAASLASPIITQQGVEDVLMIQCGQSMEQGIQETLEEQTQLEAVQETEREETVRRKPQGEDTPQMHDEEEIPPEATNAYQAQQRQQQPENAELVNFLALTQNPPAHLIAEPEPQAFVPFIAYKPRYLKSRRKKGKSGRTYGLPIVRDKGAHDRYQNLVPLVLTPDITSPEDSIASQADRHHNN